MPQKTPFTGALLDGGEPVIAPAWGYYWIDERGDWVGQIDDYGRETIRPDDIYELRLSDGRSALIRFLDFGTKDWLRAGFKAVVMPSPAMTPPGSGPGGAAASRS